MQFPNNIPPDTPRFGINRDHHPISPSSCWTSPSATVPRATDTSSVDASTVTSLWTSKVPLFMYMHGGGFVTGGLETDDAFLRRVQVLDCVIVSIE